MLIRRTMALIWAPGPTSYSLLQPPTLQAAVAVADVAAVAVAAAAVASVLLSRAFRVSSHL